MKYWTFCESLLCSMSCLKAQEGFVSDSDVVEEKISFELLSNLIIVPVKVTDLDLNFILATVVTKTIIFSFKGAD